METIWHDLRKKPIPLEYLLVETHTKHYPYRVCLYFEDGTFRDAYKTSYFFPKSCKVPHHRDNDFTVKRWAYIKDIK